MTINRILTTLIDTDIESHVALCYYLCVAAQLMINNTTTTTVLRPFVRDYPGELVPEESLTHPPS